MHPFNNNLDHARYLATVEHVLLHRQMYGPLPYTHHLAAVEAVLRRFGIEDEALLVASWLHDITEDCKVKRKVIAERFGERVAELVWAVTNEPGENRKARHAATYPKIRETVGAIILKLADRIANVEAGGNLVRMYQKEYEDFRRMLYTPGQADAMWEHLDSLLLTPANG